VNRAVELTAEEEVLVRAILAKHLPAGVRVRVFGSRARGAAKPWSDLDLALTGDGPLSLAVLAELAEAFDESALPWKVDLVDRASVGEEFGRLIDESSTALD
jgi:predicted nucleotidyltransferase